MRPLIAAAFLLLLCASAPAQLTIPNVPLTDQNGHAVRFYDDLVKGRLVVVNFIFTSCTTVCSPMGANFAALQQRLGDRAGVTLVSVSIDPSVDTPSRLKAWSQRFGAKPGWTLLTGKPNDVIELLKAMRVYTPDRISHAPIALVGNGATGQWERVSGLLAPDKIAGVIDTLRTTHNSGAAAR